MHYLKCKFYFDVHPPLGKILVALAGLLLGYNRTFEFKSSEKYPNSVPYVTMWVMMAMFGVALVPLGWYTAVELGMSPWACHLVALMVLCGMLFLPVRWLGAKFPNRCRMVVHIEVHFVGFHVTVLYFHHSLLSYKVSQSTIPVSLM